jgi:DNA polymerase-1
MLFDVAEHEPSAPAAPEAVDLAGKRVYVVDSHSLIFQVFHVIAEMTSPAGQQVNAVFGFTRDLLYLLEKHKPDFLFAAFDASGHTFRHDLYSGYKEGREEMPEELRPQIPHIQRICAALGIPVLEMEPYEADDILATIARQVDAAGGECVLVTGDKDCRQLLSERTRVYNIRKDELFGVENLRETWGIRPDQVVDFQALVGDAVDTVPGVPLIGPKTATQLLEKYDTLENLLAHAAEVPGKKGQNLQSHAEQARLSRTLARLKDDVPIAIDYAAGRAGQIDRDQARAIFAELGFRSFGERLSAISILAPQPKAAAHWQADYQVVASLAELKRLVGEMQTQTRISIDTETTHVNPRWAKLVGLSFAWQPGVAYYVPVRAPAGEATMDERAVLEALRPVLENPQIEKVGQNVKYEQIVLRAAGIELAGVAFDTMIADYLLEAGTRNHSLDELARRYLAHDNIKISELIGTGKSQKCMDEVPLAQIGPYASEDADVPLRLAPLLAERLAAEKLTPLFADVEMPLVEVLAECEYNGIKVDSDRLGELSREYGKRMAAIEDEIFALAGRPFNIGSPKQLAEVLFDEKRLPVIKKTKTGRSTDSDVLEELAKMRDVPGYELAEKIVAHRHYAKLKGTYIDALPLAVHPTTGRVHTSLNQVVAATGRLSSNDPNLQNIPIRTHEGREIRSAFVAEGAGWSLLAADYSQIELRILAHYSQDATLMDAFARDEDIHARVASEVYGVPLDNVTSEMRRSAKAINFGIIYGQSPFGLAKTLDIPKEEAAAFIEAYFAKYPGVQALIERVLDDAANQQFVTTILGRRRKIEGVRNAKSRAKSRQWNNLPERTAVNTVIQGSAADLIKQAMINVYRRLRREKVAARLLLQIHDEPLFEAPQGEIDMLATLVRDEMQNAFTLDVPLKVDVKSGPNWAACEAM